MCYIYVGEKMNTTLDIKNDKDLIRLLNEKDRLKTKLDQLKYIDKSTDFNMIEILKNRIDLIDIIVYNYIFQTNDIKEIICTRDTLIKADHMPQFILTNIDDLNNYSIIFRGFLSITGKLDIYYDEQANALFAINKIHPSDMIESSENQFCKIDTSICFYPGIYKIKEGDVIGLAKEKVLVK